MVPGDGTAVWTITHSTDFAKGLWALAASERPSERRSTSRPTRPSRGTNLRRIAEAAGARLDIVHMATDFIVALRQGRRDAPRGTRSTARCSTIRTEASRSRIPCIDPPSLGGARDVALVRRRRAAPHSGRRGQSAMGSDHRGLRSGGSALIELSRVSPSRPALRKVNPGYGSPRTHPERRLPGMWPPGARRAVPPGTVRAPSTATTASRAVPHPLTVSETGRRQEAPAAHWVGVRHVSSPLQSEVPVGQWHVPPEHD